MKAVDRVVEAYARTHKHELTDEQRVLVHREITKAVQEFMGEVPSHSAPVEIADPNQR
jgi:hypothetical protein